MKINDMLSSTELIAAFDEAEERLGKEKATPLNMYCEGFFKGVEVGKADAKAEVTALKHREDKATRQGYVNVYRDPDGEMFTGTIFPMKAYALKHWEGIKKTIVSDFRLMDTILIEWEEQV